MSQNIPSEDLFENTKMSFGDHIEELRVVLVRALLGVGIGFVIGLIVGKYVVGFLQLPLKEAIRDFNLSRAENEVAALNDGIVPLELTDRLKRDRLLPKKLQIEPEQLMEALGPYLPFEVSDRPASRYRFYEHQIELEQVPELCQKIEQAGRDDQQTESKILWSLLTRDQLQTIQRISARSTATDQDRKDLIGILNQLCGQREVHQSEPFTTRIDGTKNRSWFSWMTGTPDKNKALIQLRDRIKESFDAEQSRRLNRLLIADLYAAYLGKPEIELVEIQVWESSEVNTQALNAQEVFMIWLKASFITGLIIASPWVFYQIWLFVAAGLYPHEKRYVHIYLPFSIALFLGGAALAFFGVFKPVLKFLFSFNASMGIDPDPRIGEWLSFVMFMPLGFGIAFQLPLVMLFLNRVGIFSIAAYRDKWRIAVLVIAVLSMVFTPADPISMVMLAIPLTVLYFGGILLCYWMPKGRNPFSEAYDPA